MQRSALGTSTSTKQVNRKGSASNRIRSIDSMIPWVTTLSRIILGLVLAWFGYHELVAPNIWTGYVPFLPPSSQISQLLVLVHGVILCILAVGLVVGIMPRILSGIASITMLEIVISLTVTAGLSDLVLRDIGVLGLALSVLASHHERLVLES